VIATLTLWEMFLKVCRGMVALSTVGDLDRSLTSERPFFFFFACKMNKSHWIKSKFTLLSFPFLSFFLFLSSFSLIFHWLPYLSPPSAATLSITLSPLRSLRRRLPATNLPTFVSHLLTVTSPAPISSTLVSCHRRFVKIFQRRCYVQILIAV